MISLLTRQPMPLLVLILLTWPLALPSVYAAQDQDTPVLSGSDPLSLEQALSFADQHPRLKNPAASTRFPRRPALFVGCHDLAFAGARAGEERRNQAWSSPLLSAEDAQRLEVMQRFFDVLLADLSFAHDNEAMAVAFVQLDRARARAELGQFSPLQVAKLDADYQAIRRQRAASESTQRLTRALLAQALGHPQTLPEHLTPPKPPPADQAIPTLAEVIAAAQQHNPQVRALSNEPQDAAATALLAMDLEQAALELITRLQLLGLIAEQVDTEARWRDLKLDESRTLYELEAQADLGFSMSQQTRARRDQEQVALCQALTRAELAALQGQSLITSTSD